VNAFYVLTVVSLAILQGCASYYMLTHEEVDNRLIPIESTIRVMQRDSSIVESGPFRHTFVQEPSDFVIGSGSERKSSTRYAGRVLRTETDSTAQIELKNTNGVTETYFICWLKDRTSLAFAEYDYLNITPELQAGLWCAGTITQGDQTRAFKGRIDLNTIQTIEAKAFSPFRRSALSPKSRWVNVGLGGGKGAAAFLASYSFLSGSTAYSGRFVTAFTPPIVEARRSFSFAEIAALYGVGFKSRFFSASLSAGISYVNGSEGVHFSTIGFPIDIEAAITPLQSFGFAGKIFWTSNSKKSWGGLAICLQFELQR